MALPQSDSLLTGCAGCNQRSIPARFDCSGPTRGSQAKLLPLSAVYKMFIIEGHPGTGHSSPFRMVRCIFEEAGHGPLVETIRGIANCS